MKNYYEKLTEGQRVKSVATQTEGVVEEAISEGLYKILWDSGLHTYEMIEDLEKA